jgi:hypothetical protein
VRVLKSLFDPALGVSHKRPEKIEEHVCRWHTRLDVPWFSCGHTRKASGPSPAATPLALLERKVEGLRLLPLEAGIVRVEAPRAAGDTGAARAAANS